MDPPLISESSFSAANPSAYSLAEIWPFNNNNNNSNDNGENNNNSGMGLGGLGLIVESLSSSGVGSVDESTVTEQIGGKKNEKKKNKRDFNVNVNCCEEDESSKLVSSSTTSAHDLNNSNRKRAKVYEFKDENGSSKAEAEASSVAGNKQAEQSTKPEPLKDYIHVRARRGQATDSHSLAERARREKISERMKILQDLVPGCNKVIGKALVLDEIINYIQSLQRQVEFLSMKLETVNSKMTMSPTMEGFAPKDLGIQPFDTAGMMFGSQAAREYQQGTQPEWLHMQLGGSFGRAT